MKGSLRMLIVYDSLTGNVERFIQKTSSNSIKITEQLEVNEPFILVTYTVGFGEVPKSTESFLNRNYKHMMAVAVSGNKNWGSSYGRAGEIISNQYNVPLLMKFELSGTKKDIEKFKQGVEFYYEQRTNTKMVKAQ